MILTFLVIVAIVIMGIFMFIRIQHAKSRIIVILIIALILFFYLTSLSFLKGVDLKSTKGIEQAVTIYFSWFKNAFVNIKTITGNAINLDWSAPVGNSTISK